LLQLHGKDQDTVAAGGCSRCGAKRGPIKSRVIEMGAGLDGCCGSERQLSRVRAKSGRSMIQTGIQDLEPALQIFRFTWAWLTLCATSDL
jgi:hypothetical protein